MKSMESLIEHIYGNGRYQVLLLSLLMMNQVIFQMHNNLYAFMMHEPVGTTCNTSLEVRWIAKENMPKENHNITYEIQSDSNKQCYGILKNQTVFKCSSWDYPKTYITSNLLIEKNLVCDKQPVKLWMETLFLSGIVVGHSIVLMANKCSRRIVFLSFLCCQVACSLALIFFDNVSVLCFIMFVMFTTRCLNFIGCTDLIELLPIHKRSKFGTLYWLGVGIGILMFTLVAYVLRDWHLIKYTIIFFSLSHPFLIYLYPRSPRVLLMHGDVESLFQELKRIHTFNHSHPNSLQSSKNLYYAVRDINDSQEKQVKQFSPFELPKYIVLNLILCSVFTALLSMVLFSLYLNLTFQSDNIYINLFINGFMEIITLLLTAVVTHKFGRRRLCLTESLFCGSTLVLTTFLGARPFMKLIVGSMSRAILISLFGVVNLYIIEYFPTEIRDVAFNVTLIVRSLATILCPMVQDYFLWYTNVIYGSSIIIVGLLIFIQLPETFKSELPQTLNEKTLRKDYHCEDVDPLLN